MAKYLRITPTRSPHIDVREQDWVMLYVNDPNGPGLGILGTVSGWDDMRVAVQTDDSGAAFWIPLKTIGNAFLLDGPVTMDVRWALPEGTMEKVEEIVTDLVQIARPDLDEDEVLNTYVRVLQAMDVC